MKKEEKIDKTDNESEKYYKIKPSKIIEKLEKHSVLKQDDENLKQDNDSSNKNKVSISNKEKNSLSDKNSHSEKDCHSSSEQLADASDEEFNEENEVNNKHIVQRPSYAKTYFTAEDYQKALDVFKKLKTGQFIRCACLVSLIDPSIYKRFGKQYKEKFGEQYKDRYRYVYFFVSKGPEITDNYTKFAIVSKVNSCKVFQSDCEISPENHSFLKKNSYICSRVMGLGPKAFTEMHIVEKTSDKQTVTDIRNSFITFKKQIKLILAKIDTFLSKDNKIFYRLDDLKKANSKQEKESLIEEIIKILGEVEILNKKPEDLSKLDTYFSKRLEKKSKEICKLETDLLKNLKNLKDNKTGKFKEKEVENFKEKEVERFKNKFKELVQFLMEREYKNKVLLSRLETAGQCMQKYTSSYDKKKASFNYKCDRHRHNKQYKYNDHHRHERRKYEKNNKRYPEYHYDNTYSNNLQPIYNISNMDIDKDNGLHKHKHSKGKKYSDASTIRKKYDASTIRKKYNNISTIRNLSTNQDNNMYKDNSKRIKNKESNSINDDWSSKIRDRERSRSKKSNTSNKIP